MGQSKMDLSTIDDRILVVGAGPSGLAVTVCLQKEGFKTHLIDRDGTVGGAYKNIFGDISLTSPSKLTKLPGFESKVLPEYINAGEYKQYLIEYAEAFQLQPEKLTVSKIIKKDKLFCVSFEGIEKIVVYKVVILCTGMHDHPLSPTISCEDLKLKIVHSKEWFGPDLKEKQRVLVIGGATSAIEIAETYARKSLNVTICSRHLISFSSQKVFGYDLHEFVFLTDYIPSMFVRSDCYRRPTLPGRDQGFTDFKEKGVIQVIEDDYVQKIIQNTVYFKNSPKQDFDLIINATGFAFKTPFITDIEKSTYPTGHPISNLSGESTNCENLFLIGFPCAFGVWSEFLRGIAKDSIDLVKIIKSKKI
jgi:thioredoxin reductase